VPLLSVMRSTAAAKKSNLSFKFPLIFLINQIEMIVFPNCKINLGLNILRKREDGFHELETVFYPLPVHDILEIVYLKKLTGKPGIPFSVSGIEIETATSV
jgi:hypothetical protein